jgi:hypothetical protein
LPLRTGFLPLDFLPVFFEEPLPPGDAELPLLIFIGASSSSDDASPARRRSSSSISAMASVVMVQFTDFGGRRRTQERCNGMLESSRSSLEIARCAAMLGGFGQNL